MKIKTIYFSAVLLLSAAFSQAQNLPAGFVKGQLTLADNSVRNGYVKENIKRSASVCFLESAGKEKITYEGNDLNGVTIDSVNYLCIGGDFFRLISNGKLKFLQKSSQAAGKIIYNGNDPVVNSGTEGKPGDYFLYSNNSLKIVVPGSINGIIGSDLKDCTAAIEKARSLNGDMSHMRDVVETFNQFNKKNNPVHKP